jgi:hypothetical protein
MSRSCTLANPFSQTASEEPNTAAERSYIWGWIGRPLMAEMVARNCRSEESGYHVFLFTHWLSDGQPLSLDQFQDSMAYPFRPSISSLRPRLEGSTRYSATSQSHNNSYIIII